MTGTFKLTANQQILKTLNSTLSGSQIGNAGGEDFINSVWSMNSFGDATPEQQTQMVQNLFTTGLNIVTNLLGLGTGESKKANTEEKQVKKAQDNLDNNVQKTQSEMNAQIAEINNQIQQHLEELTKKLEEAEKKGEEITEQQKQLEELQVKIKEEQEKLKTAKTDKEKQEILTKLQGYSAQITAITEALTATNEEIVETQEQALNQEEEMITINENSNAVVNVITEACKENAELAQTLGITFGTKAAVQGSTNIAQGTAAATKAAALAGSSFLSFGTSGALAVKYERVATDQTGAGTTRLQFSADTLKHITQTLQNIGNMLNQLPEFQGGVGTMMTDFSDMFGSYTSTIAPIITATGSAETVEERNQELNTAIEEDLSGLENTEEPVENTEESGNEKPFGADELAEEKHKVLEIDVEDLNINVA